MILEGKDLVKNIMIILGGVSLRYSTFVPDHGDKGVINPDTPDRDVNKSGTGGVSTICPFVE